MGTMLELATEAFSETLAEVELTEVLTEQEQRAIGRRAALLAVAMHDWKAQLGAILDGRQVRELLGITSRQGVFDLVKRHRLLALDQPGADRGYPAFQFTSKGRSCEVMPEVLAHFNRAHVSAHTVAAWFTTGQRLLEGQTPAAWLRDGRPPESVVEAARRTAARLGR